MNDIYEEDVFKASQILEAELIGKGYTASSLATELKSATSPSSSTSLSSSSDPLPSFPIVVTGNSRRSSVDSTTASNDDNSDDYLIATTTTTTTTAATTDDDVDPFEILKGQLKELNSAVCETKTLHKKLCNTLLLDHSLGINNENNNSTYAPPLELLLLSVVSLIDRKSRDRERQTNYLKTIDSSIRKSTGWMTLELIKDLEQVTANLKCTLYDDCYSYDNPLPTLHCLSKDTTATTQSMEELKELMFVNKHQVQELNVRLRTIAKTVHDVRMDTRKISQFFQATNATLEDGEEQVVFTEKGQVEQKVKEIMCGLEELDMKYSMEKKLFLK